MVNHRIGVLAVDNFAQFLFDVPHGMPVYQYATLFARGLALETYLHCSFVRFQSCLMWTNMNSRTGGMKRKEMDISLIAPW